MTGPEKLAAAERVVAFAREQGFGNAHLLFWDWGNPEYPVTDLNEWADQVSGVPGDREEFGVGIQLSESSDFITVRVESSGDPDDPILRAEVLP